jgi:hypothetical protein
MRRPTTIELEFALLLFLLVLPMSWWALRGLFAMAG